MNLFRHFAGVSLKIPDHAFLEWPGHMITRSELLMQAAGIARSLQSRVPKGSHIGIFSVPSPHLAAAFLGVWGADMVAVPLNPLLSARELLAQILEAETGVMLAEGEALALFQSQGLSVIDISEERYVALADLPEPSREGEENALILFTSGTSAGRPSAVVLPHRALLHNAKSISEAFEFCSDDVFLGVLPYFHCFALMVNFIIPGLEGASVRCLSRFRPQEVLAEIREGRVTIAALIPAMLKALLGSRPAREDFESVRWLISGGEALGMDVAVHYREKFGILIAEGYGMTEHSPVISVHRDKNPAKLGTVGTPLPGVSLRILPPGGEEPLDTGAVGEVSIKSESLMKGYLNLGWDQRLTEDGFFRTGDLGLLDQEGYLHLKGRLKELIISAGENIHPREVEEAVLGFPGLMEAACVGIPSGLKGEEPALAVVPASLNLNEIKVRLRENLPGFKRPRIVVGLDELPRTQTGKLSRVELRKILGA